MSLAHEEQVSINVSPLLEKARQLGLSLPLDLERLAVSRGCVYYDRNLGAPTTTPDNAVFSDAELAIALITSEFHPRAQGIRLAAALLAAADVNVEEVIRLAKGEKCAPIVRYIAQCGNRFEPDNLFWQQLLARLPEGIILANFPHPTRFVEMTGMDRGKIALVTKWIRPRHAAGK